MEDVETETTEGTTGGNPAEEEKLLPPGAPPPSAPLNPEPKKDGGVSTSPILILPPEDLLHGGNAVLAAQEQREGKGAPEESPEELLADRDLRETGIKEALPRKAHAPSKIAASAEGATDKDGLPKIHTYAEDMSAEIRKRGATISSIITAEKMKEPEEAAPIQQDPRQRLLILGVALFLFVAGAGAIAAVFFFTGHPQQSAAAAPSIIPVNRFVTVSENGKTPLAELLGQAKNSAQLNLGELEAVSVVTGSSPESAETILTNLGAPNELARNATSVFVGLHSFDHVQPFLIISVSAYDRAFEAMLTWESTIGTGLGSFFAPSGTPSGITSRPPALSFADDVADNLDVRRSQAAWPILYAFPRQDLLVITTNENTLREILTRLTLQNASNQ